MIREYNDGTEWTALDDADTGGLGSLTLHHPAGTFGLTPASRVLMAAIVNNQDVLNGIGIDWGSGVGTQAILAARIGAVERVYGLEISEENVRTAARNAAENGVAHKTRFILSDAYTPFGEADRLELEALKGRVGFIVSNPPSSDWDDGFGFRRRVMSDARAYLKPGGLILLNISYQYGPDRVVELARMDGFRYEGVTATTGLGALRPGEGGASRLPGNLRRGRRKGRLRIYLHGKRRHRAHY